MGGDIAASEKAPLPMDSRDNVTELVEFRPDNGAQRLDRKSFLKRNGYFYLFVSLRGPINFEPCERESTKVS